MELTKKEMEEMITQILVEKLSSVQGQNTNTFREFAGDVIKVGIPKIMTGPKDRLDTGDSSHQVYTHDVFSLKESARLGCGIMEMEHTTFDWTLNYDEIDYVIEGSLTIYANGSSVTAGPGEIILIPKGSHIQFSVLQSARFLYITYPADWADQK